MLIHLFKAFDEFESSHKFDFVPENTDIVKHNNITYYMSKKSNPFLCTESLYINGLLRQHKYILYLYNIYLHDNN